MKPITIDFAPPSPWGPGGARSTRRSRVLLAGAVLLCATSLWGALALQRAEAAQRARLAELAPAAADSTGDTLTAGLGPEQLRTVHHAVASLQTPWVDWLAALERHLPEGATLTQLELIASDHEGDRSGADAPTHRSVRAKLQLQARQVDDMVSFLNALKRDPLLARLNVSRQDMAGSDDGVWVQFALEGPLLPPASAAVAVAAIRAQADASAPPAAQRSAADRANATTPTGARP